LPNESSLERFSVYGFSIDYPAVCRVEINPKSLREIGDIVFHFPDREKVFLSWGQLAKAREKFQTIEAQADHAIDVIRKARNIKNFQMISQDSLDINSHEALYKSIQVEEILTGFLGGMKTIRRKAYSLHVHCDRSSRYFVVYVFLTANAPDAFDKVFRTMISSIKCH
jgi:hypothetical protein